MSVIVLGADGYLGWALLCKLAATVKEPLIAVDDLSKRRRGAQQGTDSAIPILPFDQRIALLRRVTSRTDIVGMQAEVVECIGPLVREHAPRTVVHLAQIPSAPYSMASFAAARETIENNEIGNLAVLYALPPRYPVRLRSRVRLGAQPVRGAGGAWRAAHSPRRWPRVNRSHFADRLGVRAPSLDHEPGGTGVPTPLASVSRAAG